MARLTEGETPKIKANSIVPNARRTALIYTLQAAVATIDAYRMDALEHEAHGPLYARQVSPHIKQARESLLAAIDAMQAIMLNSELPRRPQRNARKREMGPR